MKIINNIVASFPSFLCLMVLPFPLLAAKPIDVAWKDVCQVAGNRQLEFTTPQGDFIEGRCVRVTFREIVIDTGHHRLLTLERGTLSMIFLRPRGKGLKSLWKDVYSALKFEFGNMLSEAGPFALGGVPATLAWGAAATPFCAIGDLVRMTRSTQEIRVI